MPPDRANNPKKDVIYSPEFINIDFIYILSIYHELDVNAAYVRLKKTQQDKVLLGRVKLYRAYFNTREFLITPTNNQFHPLKGNAIPVVNP